jgi:HK97 family phage major capsid protein
MTDPRILDTPLLLDRAAASAEALTIPVSFASDAIIDDPWNGPTQLSMDPAAVDLSAATARGLPVQEMHQRGIPVGRVEQVRIDGGRIVGLMRFSASARGRELYRDCADGIITDTSVGASIYAVREEPGHLVAIRWRPDEVSLVDRGADPAVGINRASAPQHTEQSMSEPSQAVEPTGSAPTQATTAPVVEITRADQGEQQRIANIRELARYAHGRLPDAGLDRMGDDFVACGQPFEVFRAKVWELIAQRQAQAPAVGTPPPAQIGMSQAEAGRFSIVRAVNAALTGDWKRAGFELEASRAVADRLNRQPRGFFVPLEVQAEVARASLIQRAETQSAGNPTYGGFLVPTDYRVDLFIDALRPSSVAMSAGVRSLPGLVGNLSIPRKTGVGSFSWLSEGEDAPQTDITVGSVPMAPRTIAGGIYMTRRLLQQSSPAIEMLVRTDLVEGCALAIDLAVFHGDGVKAPRGITNTTGVNTQTVSSAGTPTWTETVGFETEVETDNALAGSLRYITTPAVVGKMKVTAKAANQAIFIMSDAGTVNGYPVSRSTQLNQHTILFGDFSQVMVGFWGVLDIKPDEAALAASGGLVIRVFQDADVAVRQPTAFCKNA